MRIQFPSYLQLKYLIIFASSISLSAQKLQTNEKLSSQRWNFTLGLGMTQFLSDLGGSKETGTHRLRDLDYQSSRYCFDLGIEHFNKKNNLGISAGFNYARLYANDKYSKEINRRDRNLSVLTHIYTLDLHIIYAPFKNIRFYSGISGFYFEPTTQYNNQIYKLRSMGTEGQLLNGGKNSYGKFSTSIPIGIQFKCLTFNKGKSELWLDIRTHKSFTDYLDDVSGYYADNNAIEAKNGKTAAALADRSTSQIPGFSTAGAIRGNPNNNDNYSYLIFSIKTRIQFKSKDRDKDGVPDQYDSCPNSTRNAVVDNKGCQDSDEDGVDNNEDSCANTKGLARFNGCPDSDNDEIPDKLDPCPLNKGMGPGQGCPDSDGDRVPDNLDKCLNLIGSVSNNGCPEMSTITADSLNLIAEGIYFNTGSYQLSKESHQNLITIASVLNRFPELKVIIEGHADSVGSDASNLILSSRRAEVVKELLIKMGVAPGRLYTYAYGELKPLSDNGPSTRARNRVVRFKLMK